MKMNARIRSFYYAFAGIKQLFKQDNAKIHAVVALVVIVAGFVFKIAVIEWIALLFAIGLVLSAEAFNTAIEFLADRVSLAEEKQIGAVKDVAAGAVLIAAVTAAAVGLFVFIPYLLECF